MSRRIIIAILLCMLVLAAFAAPRRVMYEHFTSTTCGPCAGWEPYLNDMVASYDADQVVQVDYHTWWPGAGSHFYFLNPEPIDTVVPYYEVSGVPSMWFDAVSPDYSSATTYAEAIAALEARIDAQLAEEAPIDIQIEAADGNLHVVITIEEPQTGDNRLRFYITENDISFAAPNGLTEFSHIFREAYPAWGGTVVDLSGETVTLDIPYTLDGTWNAANLEAVVFVQNQSTKEIYNANETVIPPPSYLFTVTPESDTYSAMADEEEIVMTGTLANVGAEDDRYAIELASEYPSGWLISWCSGALCLPEMGSCTTSIAADAEEELTVHVAPMEIGGTGTFHLIVTSVETGNVDSLSFTLNALTGGGDVLLVADEADFGGADVDNSSFYTEALDAIGLTYEVYDRDDGPIDLTYASTFSSIVWYTGATYNDILDDDDQELVASYMTAGGNFIMSSSDLGWDMIANLGAADWYEMYFHNSFDSDVDDQASVDVFSGVEAPYTSVSDELIDLEGQNFSNYHDILHPMAGATTILSYDGTTPTEHAGLIWDDGTTKLAYLGFGMEYMSDADEREELLRLLLVEFMEVGDNVKEDIVGIPEDFEIVGNYPNPFNPATEIEYRLDKAGDVKLEIFNALGHSVVTLVEGHKDAGSHKIEWFGLDNSGNSVTSGLYLMKLTIGNETATKSLLLSK